MKTYFSIKSVLNNNLFMPKTQKESEEITPREALILDIQKTQNALEMAYAGFDNATDPDLIDCYIYEVNSALKRYRFLLHQAERMHLFISDHSDSESSQLFIPTPLPSNAEV